MLSGPPDRLCSSPHDTHKRELSKTTGRAISFPKLAVARLGFPEGATPTPPLIKLGIGDITLPLAPAIIEALHAAVDEMGEASPRIRTRKRLWVPHRPDPRTRFQEPRCLTCLRRDLRVRRKQAGQREHPGDLRNPSRPCASRTRPIPSMWTPTSWRGEPAKPTPKAVTKASSTCPATADNRLHARARLTREWNSPTSAHPTTRRGPWPPGRIYSSGWTGPESIKATLLFDAAYDAFIQNDESAPFDLRDSGRQGMRHRDEELLQDVRDSRGPDAPTW